MYDTHTDGKQRDGKIYSIEMQTQAAGLAVRTPDKTDFQAKAVTGEKRASGYLPEETQTRLPRDKRARTLVAVSSTTAEVGRRPVCPPIDGELKKRWSLRTTERDRPQKEGTLAACSDRDRPGAYRAERSESDRERQTPCDLAHMRTLETQVKERTNQKRARIRGTGCRLRGVPAGDCKRERG